MIRHGIGDTLLHRRQVVYSDSSYRAVVSGYVDPRLDSMVVYPKTVYQTVTNDIYHPVVVKPKKSGGDLVCRLVMAIRVAFMSAVG